MAVEDIRQFLSEQEYLLAPQSLIRLRGFFVPKNNFTFLRR